MGRVEGKARFIPLTQGKVALVDDSDFPDISAFKWCAMKDGPRFYAARGIREGGRVRMVYLHRYILGIDNPEIKVDHEDGDGLNCQRANLRIATTSENAHNSGSRGGSSKYKGVHLHSGGKWQSSITVNNIKHHLGLFVSEEEAANAYRSAAETMVGRFANYRL